MKQKWYDKKWLVILLLVVFYPVGVYALWKNKDYSLPAKVLLTAILAVYVSIMYVCGPKMITTRASYEDEAKALEALKHTYYVIEPNERLHGYVGERVSFYDYVGRITAHIPEKYHYGWESRKNPIGEGTLIGYGRWSTTLNSAKFMEVIWLVDKYGNVKPANLLTCMYMNIDVPNETLEIYKNAFK